MLSLLCALRQFSLVCGCAQSSVVSQLAIELGAAAAWHAPTAPSEPATVHVLVPDDTVVDSFCEAISNGAGNSLISHSDAEELYEPYDWEIEDDDPLAFRPQLINRRLWVAPMLCNEEAVPAPPSHASLRLRLLDSRDGNVFLATRDNTLHASTWLADWRGRDELLHTLRARIGRAASGEAAEDDILMQAQPWQMCEHPAACVQDPSR